MASAAGDTGIFHTLIRNGANIDTQDEVSYTFSAMQLPALISLLQNGCTPLLCACLRYHHQLAEYLIDNGARLNLSDKVSSQ